MKAAKKFTVAVKPVPEGYHAITPFLTCGEPIAPIDFYRRAFGAKELGRMNGPDGKTVMHADCKLGDSGFSLATRSRMDCRSPENARWVAHRDIPLRRDVDEGSARRWTRVLP